VHEGFDPLSAEFLADPYAVMASLPAEAPVFYARASASSRPRSRSKG
jgi:hypothetical protein